MRNPLADVRLEEATVNLTSIPSADGAPPQRRKRILFATSEFSDFVKAGGLGDVSAALPRALLADHDIRVLLPGTRRCSKAPSPAVSSVACRGSPRCRPATSAN
jgi:Glycogen synthase